MSDEQLDQSEIERLLGGGGGGASEKPAEPEPPADDQSATIDQSAIEALMAGVSGDAPAASETNEEPSVDDSPLQQNEIEALLAGTGGGESSAAPKRPPVDDSPLQQDEIEALLGGKSPPPPKPAPSPAPAATPASSAPGTAAPQSMPAGGTKTAAAPGSIPTHGSSPPPVSLGNDMNVLLEQAERAIASIDAPMADGSGALPFNLSDFSGSAPSAERTSLDLLRDVELELKIELGRTRMPLEEMMKLKSGSVVALDKLAGDPVDIYVNGRMVARGEVLVFNDNFCVRVAELISGDNV